MKATTPRVCCVIPNINGAEFLADSIKSLLAQTLPCHVLCVDNGSTDDSLKIMRSFDQGVSVIEHQKNLGFAGGVNSGIRWALDKGADYVVLFNNDAVAEADWLQHLVSAAVKEPTAGIVTGKLLNYQRTHFDSTGDMYSSWLLAFPRARGKQDEGQFDKAEYVFGASGGASLYRRQTLEEIGLFDEDFFAYYEDTDISFRAQLAGWRVYYEPKAMAYHRIGATSSKISGFAAYHSTKNVPLIWIKNLPMSLWWRLVPKFILAYSLLLLNQIGQGKLVPVLRGLVVLLWLAPKKLFMRIISQKKNKVTANYVEGIMYPELPPDRQRLQRFINKFRRRRR